MRFVRYGGVGKAPHAGIEIVYESRNDAWKRFVDETRDDLRTRIAFIRTHVGADLNGQMTDATLVRNYKLQYEYSPTSGRSMLNSVQVCAMSRNGTAIEECLPATKFVWGKPAKQPGFVSVGFWENAPVLTTVRDNVARNNAGYFAFSDFNNDGFADVLEKRIAPLSGANSVDESNTNQPGVMQASYRYFHNNGNGFTVYNYALNTGEPFMVAEVGDFNGDGALDLVVSTAPNQPLKVCLSPLTGQRAPTSGVIVFECSAYYSTNGLMGITSENPPPYVADLKGDGRSGMFARTDNPEVTSVCAQNECTQVVNPDLGILQKTVPEEFNPLLTPFTYTSLMQSVDFSGAGRSYDVRWTKPYYVYKIWLDNEYVYSPRWTNLRPEIRVSSLNYPTPANANIGKFTSYVYPTTYPATPVGKPPYLFDAPRQTGGMSADFNGSGYNSLAFGFKELQYGAYGVSQYSIADFTVCLSTGRALDCEVRAKYSGNNYRSIISIGNFVGDGQASILTQTMTSTPELGPFPTGNLEMCSLRGDSTGTADSNLVCEPWSGVTLNNAGQSSAGVQYYFMDLRGTGRMQIVKYHGGTNASGTFVDPGRWEVFEPVDRAATGEALDRIVSVTNGVGLESRVEYADGLRSGVVKQTGTNALTYPQRPISNPDKIVSRLIVGAGYSADRANPQGKAAERRTSYEYQDMATDVEGRGSQGFATIIATDEDTSLKTTSHFRQRWPHTGMLSSSTVEHGATVLAATTNVLSSKPIVHPKGRTVFPYIGQETVARKDLSGQELETTVTVNAYNDDYGNLNQQTVTTSASTGGNFITGIVTSYRNDTTRWLLGLPELVTTTRTVPKGTGTAAAVRQLQRIYDIETGLLKTEIAEPNNDPVRLTSTYGRNTFGQVESVTQTWIDPIDGGSKSRVVTQSKSAKGTLL